MDELQQIAELLRPLWPGVVFKLEKEHLAGHVGPLTIEVHVAVSEPYSVALLGRYVAYRVPLGSGDVTRRRLVVQRDYIRGVAESLLSALGLEVANG